MTIFHVRVFRIEVCSTLVPVNAPDADTAQRLAMADADRLRFTGPREVDYEAAVDRDLMNVAMSCQPGEGRNAR